MYVGTYKCLVRSLLERPVVNVTLNKMLLPARKVRSVVGREDILEELHVAVRLREAPLPRSSSSSFGGRSCSARGVSTIRTNVSTIVQI